MAQPRLRLLKFIPMFFAAAFSATALGAQGLDYPDTRKTDQVDDLHGVKVADPYRWLEDDDSADVKAWTDAQNARTRGYVDAIPGRAKVLDRVKAILAIGTVTAPEVRRASPTSAPRYF